MLKQASVYREFFNGNDLGKMVKAVLAWQRENNYEIVDVIYGKDYSKFNCRQLAVLYKK